MKTAIITGASGNLGQAAVKKFLVEGYKVTGTVTSMGKSLPGMADGAFEQAAVDLTSEEAASAFVTGVLSKYGTIDVAVLTVGGFAMATIAGTSTADITKQYKLNFETAYNIARPVFVQMIKQNHGRIFLIGSKPGLDTKNSKGMVAYGLAKSLIFRLAELMNDEAKGTNVVTSVVVPGTIDTPQNREAMPGSDPSNWVKPETIADIIYFHCTDAASVIREPLIKIYNNS